MTSTAHRATLGVFPQPDPARRRDPAELAPASRCERWHPSCYASAPSRRHRLLLRGGAEGPRGGDGMSGRTSGATWRRALALAALVASPALAGGWHSGDTLACSDCHTMHNSMNGEPMRYDASAAPANLLLRAENATALCLACHGQSAASQAPSVTAPSSWDPPGGGFPADLADPGHTAHALGPAPVTPPNGTTPVVMTCVTCHAPHGSGSYRNLRPSPSGTNRSTAAPAAAQVVSANGTNAAAVYVRSNVRYLSGWSAWCMDCHDALPVLHASMGHPWDVPITGAAWTA